MTGGGHALGLATISNLMGSGNYENTYACQNIQYSPSNCGTASGAAGYSFCNGTNPYTASSSGGDSQVHATTSNCNGYSTATGCTTGAPPFTVTDVNGTAYNFPYASVGSIWFPTIEDRNGNIVQVSGCEGCGNTPTTVIDSLGRTVISIAHSGGSYPPTAYNVGGLTYTPSYTTATASFSAGSSATAVGPALPPNVTCTAHFDVNDSGTTALQEISTLALPNGQQFTFHYDPTWGLLNEVDYPDGGWVRYTWKLSDTTSQVASFSGENYNNPSIPPYVGACNFQYQTPVVSTRTVGFSQGSSAAQTQTFTYNTAWDPNDGRYWAAKTTTVVTTDNVTNKSQTTNYSYYPVDQAPQPNSIGQNTPQLPVENIVATYDWTGGLLQTASKTWLDQFLLGQEETTLPSGLSAQTVHHYIQPFPVVEIEKDDSDYGTTPSLTRKTLYSYYEYNLPNKIVVEDAQSHLVTETDAYYDGQTALGQASTAIPVAAGVNNLPTYQGNGVTYYTHDETNYGTASTLPRGNPTKIMQWLSASGSVITTHTYDETGQVLSTTDGCGNGSCPDVSGTNHTTSYSYTDSPSNGNNNSSAYLTQVTDALGHTQKYTYNYATGQLVSATDANNNTSNYTYADPLERLTKIQGSPDPNNGGQRPTTTISYNDSPSSPSTTTSVLMSGSTWKTNVAVRDGMGHVVQTQLTSDPAGTDYVETPYNGMGLVSSVSNPHRTGTNSSDGSTSFTYDALGHKVTQTNPDQSVLQWCYNGVNNGGPRTCPGNASSKTGSWVDSWDEVGSHHQSVTDGLGRQVAVMEPNQSSGAITLETDYTYNLLDGLTGVVQDGNPSLSEAAHSRSFTYDWLSRLLTSSNPETGTICYGLLSSGTCQSGYDANGNLAAKTDARGRVTTYGYDPLNRLITKTASGAYTGSKGLATCFLYDTNGGSTPANAVGRLTAEWTQAGSCSSSSGAPTAGFSSLKLITAYDTTGRVYTEQTQTCTAQACSSLHPQTYTYDLNANLSSYTDGLGGNVFTQGYDGAGRFQALTSSFTPAPLLNITTFSPVGWTAATMGNAATLSQTFDNRIRVAAHTVTAGVQ